MRGLLRATRAFEKGEAERAPPSGFPRSRPTLACCRWLPRLLMFDNALAQQALQLAQLTLPVVLFALLLSAFVPASRAGAAQAARDGDEDLPGVVRRAPLPIVAQSGTQAAADRNQTLTCLPGTGHLGRQSAADHAPRRAACPPELDLPHLARPAARPPARAPARHCSLGCCVSSFNRSDRSAHLALIAAIVL